MSTDFISPRVTTALGSTRDRQRGVRGLFPAPFVSTFATKRAAKVYFYSRQGKRVGEASTEQGDVRLLGLSFTLTEAGCGNASFSLGAALPFVVELGFTVDIHLFQDTTPWYSGVLMSIPQGSVSSGDSTFDFEVFGFTQLFEKCVLRADATAVTTFQFTDVSSIAARLATDFLAPRFGIGVDPNKIESARYIAYSLAFELATSKNAFDSLASITQDFIYGVDATRDFFFRTRDGNYRSSQAARQAYNAKQVTLERDLDSVVNRLYVKDVHVTGQRQGSEDSESFTLVADNPDSQLLYGLCERVVTAPTIGSEEDVRRMMAYQLLRYADPEEKATVQLIDVSTICMRPGQNFFIDLPSSSIVLSDAFDDLDISPSWNLMLNGAEVSESAVPGYLRMTPGRGTLNIGTPSIPLFFKRVRGDFECVTEITGYSGAAPFLIGGFAGLHVRRSPSSFFEFGRARNAGAVPSWQLIQRSVIDGELITTVVASVGYEPLVLSVRRIAGVFTCRYGPDLATLTTLLPSSLTSPFSLAFSMYAALTAYTDGASYGTALASHYIRFGYFQHTQLADYLDLPIRQITYRVQTGGKINAQLQLGSAAPPMQDVILRLFRDIQNESLRQDRK